jgi:DNA-binding transcriptional LysR family regulator
VSGVMSSVEAGIGIAFASEAYGYSFGNRVKLLRLTPEPKPISVVIAAAKGRLSAAAEKFCNAQKKSLQKVTSKSRIGLPYSTCSCQFRSSQR